METETLPGPERKARHDLLARRCGAMCGFQAQR